MYCNGKPIKVYSLVAVYIIILLKGPRRDSSGRYCQDIWDYLTAKMKEEIIDYIIDTKVLRQELHHKFAGTGFIGESSLWCHSKLKIRSRTTRFPFWGKICQTKVPWQALSIIKGGDTILVEDSLNLPPDWKDHNLGGIIRMTDQEPPGGEVTNDKVHIYT